MISNNKNSILHLRVVPSLGKILLIILPHLVCFLLMIFCFYQWNISTIYLIVILVCILVSLIYFIKLHLSLSLNKSIKSLTKDSNDKWHINTVDKTNHSVDIVGTSYVSNSLIILNLIDDIKKEYSVLFTVDSLNIDQFRRLKVFLNTKQLLK